MKRELVIWGAGGQGKVVCDVATALGYTQIRFVDDWAYAGAELYGCLIKVPGAGMQSDGAANEFIVAIGDNHARAHCYSQALRRGWTPATLIHPSAIISPHSKISPGCMILPGAVVNAGVIIGLDCIINTGAVVEHDCRIFGHAHISPSATLGGNVQIGSFAHVGMGAAVLPGCCVGADAVIGAGAVILTDIPDAVTAVGVPGRIVQKSRAGGAV